MRWRADTRPRRVWLRVALAPVDGLARRLADHGQTAGTPEGRGPSGVYDANVAPLPDLILYARPACSLCDEARQAIDLVIADRRDRGLPVPNVIERDIDADPDLHRALIERIPVVELGDQRVELNRLDREGSAAHERSPRRGARRRPCSRVARGPDRGLMDFTIGLAIGAGLLSFLSPCVLPLVPAYLGQLSAVAVVGRAEGSPSRWLAISACDRLRRRVRIDLHDPRDHGDLRRGPALRLPPDPSHRRRPPAHRPWAEPRRRPPDPGPRSIVPPARGGRCGLPRDRDRHGRACRARRGRSRHGSEIHRSTGRADRQRPRRLADLARDGRDLRHRLDALHRRDPRRHPDARRDLRLGGGRRDLLVAYTLGLGIPFLLIAAVYDRAPRLLAPLLRRGRLVSIIGGALVVAIGVAMLFDWLALLPQYVPFNTQI